MTYELKHIHGIPYYLDGTTLRTFELEGGLPSEHCIPIGTYHAESDTVEYFPEWERAIESRLDAFRTSLLSHPRNALRQSIIKPQKPRSSARAPRKSTRAKNPESL